MDYLRAFADEFGLRQIVESLIGHPGVQGAVLRLDEWWLRAWQIHEVGRDDQWLHWLHGGLSVYPSLEGAADAAGWVPLRRPDLSWRPDGWDELCRLTGRAEGCLPLRLIVCLRPPASGEDEGRALPKLPETRLPVTFEVRPLARLAAARHRTVRPLVGGVSVGTGPSTYGTLGGLVEDDQGRRYGMSCAHVFPTPSPVHQPARFDDSAAQRIGHSLGAIALQPCPGHGPCDPYSSDPHIGSVDTTLIELDDGMPSALRGLGTGELAGVVRKNSMVPGQAVSFEGRTSGLRLAELGGLAVFYRFRFDGRWYCFRDLFEVRWRSFWRTLFGPVVQSGDSGAWVCAETADGPGWCGQVLGEDRRIGYAAYAANIVDAWSVSGLPLRVR